MMLLMFAWLAFLPSIAHADSSSYVKDGDSFVLRGVEYRLWGIDAFELYQTCKKDGVAYGCGKNAKSFMQSIFKPSDMKCEATQKSSRETRTVARCYVKGQDIAALMVSSGWAIDYAYFSKGFYKDQEKEARNANRGAWNSKFISPRDWRKAHPYKRR